MNKVLLRLILVIGLTYSAKVKAASVEALIDLLPTTKGQIIQATVSALPTNQRKGVEDYLAVIGVSANAGANLGIQAFNKQVLADNPCIAKVAGRFYADLQREDLRRIEKFNIKPGTPDIPLNRTIADFDLPPGWLWTKALEHSGGDKLLAMQVIGICGHDDIGQMAEGDNTLQLNSEVRSHYAISEADRENLNKYIKNAFDKMSAKEKSNLEAMGGLSKIA